MEHIQNKLESYIELQKVLSEYRKKLRDSKKQLDDMEKEIKTYMTTNGMDSIALPTGEIVLYNRKIPQTFKKESMVDTLTDKLQNQKQAEELVETILKNKTFLVEEKVRAIIKKK
jgi:microsomal dipeptidase-like Zn-dependent dipeptidase